MPWPPKVLSNLERENASLRTTICCLKRELENREGAVGRLELLLHERCETIDQLNARLEQSRAQLQHLSLQNEILVEMIAAPSAPPQLDAARSTQRVVYNYRSTGYARHNGERAWMKRVVRKYNEP
jgi:hypothetical protein